MVQICLSSKQVIRCSEMPKEQGASCYLLLDPDLKATYGFPKKLHPPHLPSTQTCCSRQFTCRPRRTNVVYFSLIGSTPKACIYYVRHRYQYEMRTMLKTTKPTILLSQSFSLTCPSTPRHVAIPLPGAVAASAVCAGCRVPHRAADRTARGGQLGEPAGEAQHP